MRATSRDVGDETGTGDKEGDELKASPGIRVLRGHTSRIDSILFSPTDPFLLVTSAEPDMRAKRRRGDITRKERCEIIFWDLASTSPVSRGPQVEDSLLEKAILDGVTTLSKTMGRSSGELYQLTEAEQTEIRQALSVTLHNLMFARRRVNIPELHGRFTTSFQSPTFSPDGSRSLYMPGERPDSNGVDNRSDVPPRILSFVDGANAGFVIKGGSSVYTMYGRANPSST